MDDNLTACQERRWNLQYPLEKCKEGWLIIFHEWLDIYGILFKKCSKQRRPIKSQRWRTSELPEWESVVENGSASEKLGDYFANTDAESEESTGIAHGIIILSKMLSCIILYAPAFILDAKPGMVPSKRFVCFTYILMASSIVFGLYVNKILIEPTLISTLPGLINRATTLLANVGLLVQNMIDILGLGCLMAITHLRHTLHDFILFHCNIISLPKSYQRRKAVGLFLTFYLLTLLSKPAFFSLMVILDSKQPEQLLLWSPGAFFAARCLLVLFLTISTSIVCFSAMIIPLLTCYLIVCSATYLNSSLKKQISRFGPIDKVGHNSRRNKQLERLLDDKTRRLIHDYSCDTLARDWPELVAASDQESDIEGESNNNERMQLDCSSVHHQQRSASMSKPRKLFDDIRTNVSLYLASLKCPPIKSWNAARQNGIGCSLHGPSAIRLKVGSETGSEGAELQTINKQKLHPPLMKSGTNSLNYKELSSSYSSNSNGLLFIHKNLIKSLSKLKGMIAIYERRFGSFHLLQICLDSLIVAQWLTTSIMEVRLKNELKAQRLANRTLAQTNNAAISISLNTERPSSLIWLSSMGVTSFVLVNTYIFITCDCLPDRMMKIRSRLFKMNVDLARSALEPTQGRVEAATDWRREYSRLPSRTNITTENESFSRPSNLCSHQTHELKANRSWRRGSIKIVATDEFSELDQVWSLYDQVVRLSELANFRLTAGTYYSKRCLLWIFGRTVSLTLLFIQIVDIYSYT